MQIRPMFQPSEMLLSPHYFRLCLKFHQYFSFAWQVGKGICNDHLAQKSISDPLPFSQLIIIIINENWSFFSKEKYTVGVMLVMLRS